MLPSKNTASLLCEARGCSAHCIASTHANETAIIQALSRQQSLPQPASMQAALLHPTHTFWCRRCTEQSRSYKCTTLPCPSARICTSICRGSCMVHHYSNKYYVQGYSSRRKPSQQQIDLASPSMHTRKEYKSKVITSTNFSTNMAPLPKADFASLLARSNESASSASAM